MRKMFIMIRGHEVKIKPQVCFWASSKNKCLCFKNKTTQRQVKYDNYHYPIYTS